ncbi:MAG: ABC transporter permease [Halobacteriaceae archaeon]
MSTEEPTQTESTTEQTVQPRQSRRSPSVLKRILYILRTDRTALTGALIVGSLFIIAAFATIDKYIFHSRLIQMLLYDPQKISATSKFARPFGTHPLGADQLGRDVLARLIYGARVSLQVALLAVSISATLGTFFGAIAGYVGGRVDDIIMRVVDSLMAFPGIILAIAIAGLLGPSIYNVVIALSVQGWVAYARLIRGEVLSVREMDYVKAAQGMGASRIDILISDILPNSIYPIIVQATLSLGTMIIAEAGLSFLGLGPQNAPSWGRMLSTGQTYIDTAWWLSLFPGIAIFITVMGFNLLGDALRDVLDPRESTGDTRRSI